MNSRVPRTVWLIVLLAGCRSQAHQVSLKPDDRSPPLHGDTHPGDARGVAKPDPMGNPRGRDVADSASAAAERNAAPAAEASFDAVAEHLAQGRTEIGKGNLEQAQLHYRRVLQGEPDNVEAHHRLAVIADKQKSFPEAERHYRAALRVNPYDADLLSDLGYSYLLQGNYSESERTLNQALRLDPRHVRATNNLGMLYGTQRNYAKAYAMFRQTGSDSDARDKMARLFPNAVLPETLTASADAPPPGMPAAAVYPSGVPLADSTGADPGAPNESMQRIKQEMDRARRDAELRRQQAHGARPAADPRLARAMDAREQNAFRPDDRMMERPGERYPDPRSAPPLNSVYGDGQPADPNLWPASAAAPATATRARPLHPSQINHAFEQIDRQADAERRAASGLWPPAGSFRPSDRSPAADRAPTGPAASPDLSSLPPEGRGARGASSNEAWPADYRNAPASPLPGGVRTLWDPDGLQSAPDRGVERADYYRDGVSAASQHPPRQPGRDAAWGSRVADPAPYSGQMQPADAQRLATQIGMEAGPGGMFPVMGRVGQPPAPGAMAPANVPTGALRLSAGAMSQGAAYGVPPRQMRPGQPGYDTPREVVQQTLDNDPMAHAPGGGYGYTPQPRGYTRTPSNRATWDGGTLTPPDLVDAQDDPRIRRAAATVDPYQQDIRRHDEHYNATLQNMDRERVLPASMQQPALPSGQYYPPNDESLRAYEEMRRNVRPGYSTSAPQPADRTAPVNGREQPLDASRNRALPPSYSLRDDVRSFPAGSEIRTRTAPAGNTMPAGASPWGAPPR